MEKYMKRAIELAEKAAAMGEIPVGAVVVKRDTGEIIAEGYNRRETDKNALSHAEITAIELACSRLGGWRLIGCDLYVTLEPCPMCCGAIINSRIERVIYGADTARPVPFSPFRKCLICRTIINRKLYRVLWLTSAHHFSAAFLNE